MHQVHRRATAAALAALLQETDAAAAGAGRAAAAAAAAAATWKRCSQVTSSASPWVDFRETIGRMDWGQ